jgi:sugar phosphate isomerase/epimerase
MHGRTYISTSCLSRERLAELARVPELPDGLCLELGSGLRREEALRLLDLAVPETRGRLLLHNYCPPPAEPFVLNLASPDRGILERSLAFCREAMAWCVRIGAPFYSVHAGLALDPRPEDLGGRLGGGGSRALDAAKGVFRESVAELAREADRLGIMLLLENHVLAEVNAADGRNDLLLFCGIEDFLGFDAAYPWASVGVLLDCGHLKVSARSLGFDQARAAAAVRERTRAVHLHDNDGITDQHRPFGPEAWFLGHVRSLPPDVARILETAPCPDGELARMTSLLAQREGVH